MFTPADLNATVTGLLDAWDQRIRVDIDVDGCRLQVAAMGARMYVEYIAVPKALRRGGYGTAILTALTGWADRRGLTLELGVSTDYGMRRTTLTRIYQRHGFQPTSLAGMVRQPADHYRRLTARSPL